mmetsp:Transcript_29066/g.25707  ORF Transcript_29066/g.25707 Transcript_29066/m.25707 type:complete len:117 (-) Transcript_29066:188-538(-)
MVSSSKSSKIKCACCTNEIKETDIKIIELDTEKEIECEHCSLHLPAKELEDHVSKCSKYLEKIEADIKNNKFIAIKPTVNRATFQCPFCETKNLERKNLLSHIHGSHGEGPGVCPI